MTIGLLSCVSFGVSIGASRASAEDLIVIVHPARQVQIDDADLARIFLRQRRFWPSGSAIVPVNQPAGSPVREAFSRTVLGTHSSSQMNHWNRAYFRGVLPPITLGSDESVVLFVANNPNAIGYVRATAANESVREVKRLRSAPKRRDAD